MMPSSSKRHAPFLSWKLLLVTMSAILTLAPSSASGLSSSSGVPTAPKRIPITVLSGFLGSGKTTLLQNMLQNKEGLRIAVIVNDVASVNIDSKLVSRDYGAETGSDAMVELQNGCACCSLSDELLTSVSEIVAIGDLKGEDGGFHHIVVELSGVADPKQVRAKFQEAVLMDMPLMERVGLDTMVSLVDSSMFRSYFESSMLTSREATPELFYRDGAKPDEPEEKEEWMKDLPPLLLEAVMAGLGGSESDEGDPVAELLVSQTETADLIVLNKADLVDETDMKELKDIVSAINPRAKTLVTSFGKVPLTSVLGIAEGKGVAEAGVVDDHREFISAAAVIVDREQATTGAASSAAEACVDQNCDDETHQHSHTHEHATSATVVEECDDPACTDDSHDHAHNHAHSHSHASPASAGTNADTMECNDPGCSDTSHSHSHSHASEEVCTDVNCDDQSHSHSHSHSTSTDALGIGSFVYKARRPFHPRRLVSFLGEMPIERGIPKIDGASDGEFKISDATKQALKSTLRSKGFAWCADSFSSAMYWSHAGKSFELNCLGAWWATLPRNQWPEDASEYVLADFDNLDHDDSTFEGSVGDRRQEVVFIGKTFSDASRQNLICDALDECLLSDGEWEEYKLLRLDEGKLQSRFANPIDAKMKSY